MWKVEFVFCNACNFRKTCHGMSDIGPVLHEEHGIKKVKQN
jgi:hypothetical protein